MKHVQTISCKQPQKAAGWQDVLCELAPLLNAVLGAFGGSSPLLGYVDEKCEIPTPNP